MNQNELPPRGHAFWAVLSAVIVTSFLWIPFMAIFKGAPLIGILTTFFGTIAYSIYMSKDKLKTFLETILCLFLSVLTLKGLAVVGVWGVVGLIVIWLGYFFIER